MAAMRNILEKAVISQADISDYKPFAHLHYRRGRLPVVDKVFTLSLPRLGKAAVIVYAFAPPHLAVRRKALGGLVPSKPKRGEMMNFINANIRIISRVVVLPEFRGAGIAAYLVRNTLDKAGVPIVEAVAAMGQYNRFFEKAGMRLQKSAPDSRRTQMIRELSIAAVSGEALLDPDAATAIVKALPHERQERLERCITAFIGAYGGKRRITDTRERIAVVLSKLMSAPAYFYYINPNYKTQEDIK